MSVGTSGTCALRCAPECASTRSRPDLWCAIKSAIADDIDIGAPRSVSCVEYRRDVKARLDRLFTGEEKIGSAEGLAFPPSAPGDQAAL